MALAVFAVAKAGQQRALRSYGLWVAMSLRSVSTTRTDAEPTQTDIAASAWHCPARLLQDPSQQQLTEAEQEALLRAKYGGLLKKKPLLPQDRKHFDSADWQLSKQGVPAPQPQLEPKLNPTAPPARRSSQLGDGQ